jgi:hypothetical protein
MEGASTHLLKLGQVLRSIEARLTADNMMQRAANSLAPVAPDVIVKVPGQAERTQALQLSALKHAPCHNVVTG